MPVANERILRSLRDNGTLSYDKETPKPREMLFGKLPSDDALKVAMVNSHIDQFPSNNFTWNEVILFLKQEEGENQYQLLDDFDPQTTNNTMATKVEQFLTSIMTEENIANGEVVVDSKKGTFQLTKQFNEKVTKIHGPLAQMYPEEVANLTQSVNLIFSLKAVKKR